MEATDLITLPNGSAFDKIKRYNWNSDDKEVVITKIHKTDLNIDSSYQREYSEKKISEIRKNWDNVAVGTITVARRSDGSLWVVDGQHRLRAALDRSDVQYLDCIVFGSSGPVEEANRFKTLNTSRKAPSSIQLHKAGLIAGDEYALMIDTMFKSHRIVLGNGGRCRVSGVCCRCVGVLKDLIKTYGYEYVDEALRLLSIIHNNGTSIDNYVIKGLVYVLKYYNISDKSRFENVFCKCTPEELKSSVTSVMKERRKGGDRTYAIGVIDEVNSHIRINKYHIKEEVE